MNGGPEKNETKRKTTMKTTRIIPDIIAIALLAAVFVVMTPSCATAPPSRFEQRMFNVETNYVPVIQVKTNVFEIFKTNTVVVVETNKIVVPDQAEPIIEVVYRTNEQRLVTWQTNVVTVQATNEAYTYVPGAGAASIAATGKAVGDIFGVGGMVSTALMGLFSLWGYVRSSKRYLTAANTAQVVETLREFIKSLPNGLAYDTALLQWMQAHQSEAGVTEQVIQLLAKEVSNPDAKVAAEQIQAIIRALQSTAPAAPKA